MSGSAWIFGATIRPGNGPYPFYSPRASSLLYACVGNDCESATLCFSELQSGPEKLFSSDPNYQTSFCFPELQKTEIPHLYFLASASTDNVLFDVPQDWIAVSEGLLQSLSTIPIVFVVGPRKVGKSSMSRYLANSLWTHTRKVAFLDLDTGQTEFTPPGSLSLKVISKDPLLGPPMCHQSITDELIYFGSMSPSDDPRRYLDGARRLFQRYLTKYHTNGIPLIVNTMGWITGLGLSLLQTVLHMIPVTHMVAFSQSETINFSYVQTMLFEASQFTTPFTEPDAPQVAYVQAAAAAGTSTSRLNRVSPVDLRSLTFSSYFLGTFNVDLDRILFTKENDFRSAIPFAIPISKIQLYETDKDNVLISRS